MPTTRYYKSRQDTVEGFIVDFVRWLVDDHPTRKGPRWELVEARDQAAGTPRQVPTQARGHGTFESLPVGFSWRDGDIQVGDWVVLRTVTKRGTDSLGAIEWQLYVSFEDTDKIGFLLMPLNDFVVGGADASPPTFPPTGYAESSFGTRLELTPFDDPADYYAVGDEGMFALVMDNGDPGAMQFAYLGECDGASPGDQRPYVVYRANGTVRWEFFTNNLLTRLSPADNLTLLPNGSPCGWRERGGIVSGNANLANRPDSRPMPTGPFFSTTSHRHFVGFFRNCYIGTGNMGLRGSFLNNRFLYFHNEFDTGSSSAAIVFKWDGVTAVT